MNVKKFTASTSREAWRKVRDALGPDAVILSNRTVDGIAEILALASDEMPELNAPAVEKPVVSESTLSALMPKRLRGKTTPQPTPDATVDLSPQARSASAKTAPAMRSDDAPDQAAGLAQALGNARQLAMPAPASTNELGMLMQEIRSMRGMLETQLAELSWSHQQKREPIKSLVLRELLAAGFSASLARYLTQNLPTADKLEASLQWIKSVLTRNLSAMRDEQELLEHGGVYALVGPTGVGKTTTTAKLAARCVMRHGPGKLALITTDGYRIGGYEQLRIYGKILGVMVHSVKDEADLRIALDELKGKHTVLIDTVGVSQRDQMVAEQIAMLSGIGGEVKRLLCMSATSTGETLNEVVQAYQGNGLAGCIVTKLDESATIGAVLDVIIRRKLNLFFVANGQRVPEDLHIANTQYLVDRAFKLKRETAPFQFTDEELPLVVANAARGMHDQSLRGVNLG